MGLVARSSVHHLVALSGEGLAELSQLMVRLPQQAALAMSLESGHPAGIGLLQTLDGAGQLLLVQGLQPLLPTLVGQQQFTAQADALAAGLVGVLQRVDEAQAQVRFVVLVQTR